MQTFKNPILKGFNPDPSICRVGGDYYLITSTFEFSPCVPIYHSKNLVDWTLINYCLTREEQLPLNGMRASKGIYAPTIRYNDGVFYMVTTNVGNGGNFYVTTEDIKGEWSDPIWVDIPGIDPTIFFDEGKAYMTTNRVGERHVIGLTEIDISNGKKLTETKWISDGTGGSYVEAPHLYKRDGYYYLVLAEGGTQEGHMVTIHRASTIYGPYESCPHNPVLTHRDRTREQIKGTGHADMVWDENDNCWMVCLGYRTLQGRHLHNLGRETFLTPVKWLDGWPIVGDNGLINAEMEGPIEGQVIQAKEKFNESFETQELNLRWNYIRNRDEAAYRLDPKGLMMINKGVGLSSYDQSPCFIGVRQTEFEMLFEAKIELENDSLGGITAYQNGDFHYDVLIRKEEKGQKIGVRKKIFDLEVVLWEVEITDEKAVTIGIESDENYYYFYYKLKDGSKKTFGKGMVAALCTEVTHFTTFTGVYLGIYCDQGAMRVINAKYEEVD